MKQYTVWLLVLLSAHAVASSVSASSFASAWMRSHKSPTDDQLGELQQANPAAFAIVSALLNKHAKGQQLAPELKGPDVFRAMMTPRHLSAAQPRVAVPYATAGLAEMSRPVVDQAKYNPNTAAERDESSVSRLLAAVAQMGGDKGRKIALLNKKRNKNSQVSENSLTQDASLFAEDKPAVVPEQVVEEAAAAVQPPEPEEAAPAPEKKENSYLKGIDLSGDMPVAASKHRKHMFTAHDSSNSLASFSFDDSAPATPAPKPKKVVPAAPKKESAFLKFLYGVKKAPAPTEQPVAKKAPERVNPYANWLAF